MFQDHKQFLASFVPKMGVLGFEITILFVCLLLQKLGMNLTQLEETPMPYFLTDYNQ